MRFLIIVIAFGLFSFQYSSEPKLVAPLEVELNDIIQDFKSHVIDKDACQRVIQNAVVLLKEIDINIRKADKRNNKRVADLHALKNETESLISYMAAIGDVGEYVLSIETFDKVNRKIGAEVEVLVVNKGYVDVIAVKIGEYEAYLLTNNNSKKLKAKYNYRWISNNGVFEVIGKGKMVIPQMNMTNIYSNRDYQREKDLASFEVDCKIF